MRPLAARILGRIRCGLGHGILHLLRLIGFALGRLHLAHGLLHLLLRLSHLLLRGYLLSLAQRFGDDVAAAAGPRVLAGVAPVTAGRLRRALAIDGNGADAIAKVLQLFPTFRPRSYVDARIELVSPDRVRLAFGPSPIFDESDGFTWLAGLGGDADRALDALVRGVNPSARCRPCATEGDELFAYEASVDPAGEPGHHHERLLDQGNIQYHRPGAFAPGPGISICLARAT